MDASLPTAYRHLLNLAAGSEIFFNQGYLCMTDFWSVLTSSSSSYSVRYGLLQMRVFIIIQSIEMDPLNAKCKLVVQDSDHKRCFEILYLDGGEINQLRSTPSKPALPTSAVLASLTQSPLVWPFAMARDACLLQLNARPFGKSV